MEVIRLKANCAYCGKEIELNKGQIMAMKRGSHVYCSEECRLRFRALERGVTEETILEKIEEAGGEILQSELLKRFGIRDNASRVAVTELISFLERLGVIRKIKQDEKTVILKLVVDEKNEEEEVNEMEEKIIGEEIVEKDTVTDEVAEENITDEIEEFEVIEEVVNSIDVKHKITSVDERLTAMEKRIELLEKKVQILRNAIEKLAKALSGE